MRYYKRIPTSLASILVDKKAAFNQRVGEKLRKLRKAKNVSQSIVGAEFALSQDTVSEIERGKRPLEAFELAAFSHYYEKPITYFFMDSPLPPKN